jgi:hypothetical protein
VLATLLGGALTGCGSDSTPASQVPALQGRLDAVDEAVSGGRPAAVRRAVDRLERTAYDAERSGDLDHADAAGIVAAGDALVAALPTRQPASATTPSPTPSLTPTPSPSETHTEAPAPPEHEKPHKPPKPPKPPKPEPHKPPKGPGPGHDHGHGPGHGHED